MEGLFREMKALSGRCPRCEQSCIPQLQARSPKRHPCPPTRPHIHNKSRRFSGSLLRACLPQPQEVAYSGPKIVNSTQFCLYIVLEFLYTFTDKGVSKYTLLPKILYAVIIDIVLILKFFVVYSFRHDIIFYDVHNTL